MAGLVPAIHESRHALYRLAWMPGTRQGMTVRVLEAD
jgi:hypothetical protein